MFLTVYVIEVNGSCLMQFMTDYLIWVRQEVRKETLSVYVAEISTFCGYFNNEKQILLKG